MINENANFLLLAYAEAGEKSCGCGPDCLCGDNCACGADGKCAPACTCAD
mgnify:FL=1